MEPATANRHLMFETSFGWCAILFRKSPFKIFRVLLPAGDRQTLKFRAEAGEWGSPGSHPIAVATAEAIIGYFDGKNPKTLRPPWEWLDFDKLTSLEQRVLFATAEIPRGQTCSYKELAEKIGRPRAYRFVGSVMAKNPFPIIIPCHRVVRRDGTVGKFGGGSEMKKKMIGLEAAFASSNST